MALRPYKSFAKSAVQARVLVAFIRAAAISSEAQAAGPAVFVVQHPLAAVSAIFACLRSQWQRNGQGDLTQCDHP
jgi:hypothetical protein